MLVPPFQMGTAWTGGRRWIKSPNSSPVFGGGITTRGSWFPMVPLIFLTWETYSLPTPPPLLLPSYLSLAYLSSFYIIACVYGPRRSLHNIRPILTAIFIPYLYRISIISHCLFVCVKVGNKYRGDKDGDRSWKGIWKLWLGDGGRTVSWPTNTTCITLMEMRTCPSPRYSDQDPSPVMIQPPPPLQWRWNIWYFIPRIVNHPPSDVKVYRHQPRWWPMELATEMETEKAQGHLWQ